MSDEIAKAPYNADFYHSIVDGSLESARAIVPMVLDLLVKPELVCDLGCGVGSWLSVFRKRGLDVHGFDGTWVSPEALLIPRQNFTPTDLTIKFPGMLTYDIAMSVEVAEHLPESSANQFVETLTNLAPVVLFSAAIPNQGGTSHINEQWQSYWIEKFARRGYKAIDCIRPKIWNNDAIKYWYRQNLFIFANDQALAQNPALRAAADLPNTMPANVVHPEAFIGESQPTSLKRALKVLPGLLSAAAKRRLRGRADA